MVGLLLIRTLSSCSSQPMKKKKDEELEWINSDVI